MSEWQEGGHGEIRDATDDVIAGTLWDRRTRALLRVLALAEVEAPELFRGMTLPRNMDVEREFVAGASIFPPLSSFTTNFEEARFRATRRSGQPQWQLIFRLVPGARAVPIENLSTREETWAEREWYTAGRFVVTGSDLSSDGLLSIHLSHKEVYRVG